MSMFDWVAFEMDCPMCCARVYGFQTKDRGRSSDLHVLLPWTVTHFYAACPACEVWIEFVNGEMVQPSYDAGTPDEVMMLPIPTNGKPWKH